MVSYAWGRATVILGGGGGGAFAPLPAPPGLNPACRLLSGVYIQFTTKNRWLFGPVCVVTSVVIHDYNLSGYSYYAIYMIAYMSTSYIRSIVYQKYSILEV